MNYQKLQHLRKPIVSPNKETKSQDYKITSNTGRSQNVTNKSTTLVLRALKLKDVIFKITNYYLLLI